MLNKNLINVKNLLKIIISCLVILSMIKSCSMAYTFEQFKQFIDACYEENITTNAMTKNDLKYAIDNWYKITDTITQNNIDTTQYTSFAIRGLGSSHLTSNNYMEVWFFQGIGWAGSENNGGKFSIETPNLTTIYIRDTSTEKLKYASQHTWYEHFCCGIFSEKLDRFNTDTLTNTKWDPNEHPLTPPFNFTQYRITTIDDYNILKFNYVGNTALGKLGDNTYYQLQVRIKDSSLTTLGTALFNENQECYYRDNALIVENNQTILANTVYLSYYEPYYLEFTIYSDSTNYEINGYLYKFYPPNAVIENGQIVSQGSGDFTNQDATIQNQNFFTNLYNNMFTFSGEYIEQKLEKLKKDNILPSGDAKLEKAFIDLINNNNGDFKIAWSNFTPNLSVKNTSVNFEKPFIESGEVNFSKMERENQAFQDVMTWTRTILGFSLGALLLKNLWRTFISMLGIGYSIYNTDEDEKEIANKGGKK